MDKFFNPQSVAVFGVSDKPMKLALGDGLLLALAFSLRSW